MTNTLTIVTTFIIRNHEWAIVYNEKAFEGDTQDRHYTGIRREWITDKKLNRKLNGIEANLSNTIEEVIERITDIEEIDYMVDTIGMDRMEATIAYFTKKYQKA